MSKSFPNSKRKWDLYFSCDGPCKLKELLFSGSRRFVVQEEFSSREEWDRERSIDSGFYTEGTAANRPNKQIYTEITDKVDPPPEHKYFYGADYV